MAKYGEQTTQTKKDLNLCRKILSGVFRNFFLLAMEHNHNIKNQTFHHIYIFDICI